MTKQLKTGVLTYLLTGDFVWLGMKKKAYSKGKWNGFGGKVEAGETSEEAAVREVQEECGAIIDKNDLKKVAEFYYHEDPDDWQITVFVCSKWQGTLVETEEMRPQKFKINGLPYSDMWENDKLWVEKVLTTKKVMKGTFWHDKNGKVLRYKILPNSNIQLGV